MHTHTHIQACTTVSGGEVVIAALGSRDDHREDGRTDSRESIMRIELRRISIAAPEITKGHTSERGVNSALSRSFHGPSKAGAKYVSRSFAARRALDGKNMCKNLGNFVPSEETRHERLRAPRRIDPRLTQSVAAQVNPTLSTAVAVQRELGGISLAVSSARVNYTLSLRSRCGILRSSPTTTTTCAHTVGVLRAYRRRLSFTSVPDRHARTQGASVSDENVKPPSKSPRRESERKRSKVITWRTNTADCAMRRGVWESGAINSVAGKHGRDSIEMPNGGWPALDSGARRAPSTLLSSPAT